MIYATPLEISADNQLKSEVLESFQYDQKTKTITWIVKPGLKYADGSALTANDIAFAVARMAYTRPTFPVIEHIAGLADWVKSTDALSTLPSGITISDRTIVIKLQKNTEHPLFRFCLEVFSIIPQRCVDAVTNKLKCKLAPASGYYDLVKQTDKTIEFTLRDQFSQKKIPQKITFQYVPAENIEAALTSFDKNTVVAGNEMMFSSSSLGELQTKLTVKFTPAARFSVLLINPEIEPFGDIKCRRYFASVFRDSYRELAGINQLESSVFTKILPGYLSAEKLQKNASYQLTDADVANCRSLLAKATIKWGYTTGEKHSVFIAALVKTFKTIGIKQTDPVVTNSRKILNDSFANGKLALFNGSSGFWALDPVGDMKMLFTPNLHKALRHVSASSDLQKMIANMDDSQSNYIRINQHLFDEAIFNVYSHLRRFFASPSSALFTNVPFAVTSPAPWQVFGVK